MVASITTQEYQRFFFEEILGCFSKIDGQIKDMQRQFGYLEGNMKTTDARRDFALNIIDEVDELVEAIDEGNVIEVRDAVADILVFTLSLLHHTDTKLVFGERLTQWISQDSKKDLDLSLLDYIVKVLKKDSLFIVENTRTNSFRNVVDIAANICYSCYIISEIFEFDIVDDMHKVILSNLSKFCVDESDLSQTINKYTDLGVEVYHKGDFPKALVYSSKDQTDKDGKPYRANKFLKSVSFKNPELL